jgi:prepilin-type N-terminal cleavage/methylation domain-containing protein
VVIALLMPVIKMSSDIYSQFPMYDLFQHRSGAAPRPSRRGVSLLELLLVLGLLVIIAAMAAPTLRRPMEAQKLRKSADLVQAQWSKARIRAMKAGQIFVFQYQPVSGRFRVVPWYSEDLLVEAGEGVDPANPAAGSLAVLDELPEGIEFLTSMTRSESRSLAIEQELSEMSGSAAEENSWSAPIMFYPDGTTSTAELVLTNEYDDVVTLRLRGLTGIARVIDGFPGEAP